MEITPNEDLMREHGILHRLLLIYENLLYRINYKIKINYKLFLVTAIIMHNFIELYHEKTEEKYIFPVLIKHNIHKELINELILQHKISNKITKKIINILYDEKNINVKLLYKYISNFIYMYKYHSTREDTIVFQEFRKLLSDIKYQEISNLIENEEKLISNNQYTFNKVLKYVIIIEKHLDINDLSNITKNIKYNLDL